MPALEKQEKISNPTKDKILHQLSIRRDIKEITTSIAHGKFFGEELYQELFVVLCSLEEKRLVEMYTNNWLDFYIIRTLTNMYKSTSSQFYYNIKKPQLLKAENVMDYDHNEGKSLDRIDNIAAPLVEDEPHRVLNSLEEGIEQLGWYDKGMIKLYLELGTLKKVSEKSNINVCYVSEAVSRGKKQLKDIVKEIEKRKEDSILYDQPELPDSVLESFKRDRYDE